MTTSPGRTGRRVCGLPLSTTSRSPPLTIVAMRRAIRSASRPPRLVPPAFVHTHVHSHYSLLDGAAQVEDLVEAAARCEQPALSLTDQRLDEAHWRLGDRLLTFLAGHLYVGDDVVALQQRLLDMGFDPGRCDGIFGRQTEAALREFQRNVGLLPVGS